MKIKRIIMVFITILFFVFGCGAMQTTPIETGLSGRFKMVEDKDIGSVYLAQGFNFTGYDEILVVNPSTVAVLPKKNIEPEELGIYLKHQLLKSMGETGVFPKVTDDMSVLTSNEATTSSKILVLESAITDYEPGNKALRALVGFGSGAAKVQIEMEIKDANTKQTLFKSADRRLDPGALGMGGVAAAADSKGLIMNAISTIVQAHSSFIKRIAAGGKIEKE